MFPQNDERGGDVSAFGYLPGDVLKIAGDSSSSRFIDL
jgi:hypothetical protein